MGLWDWVIDKITNEPSTSGATRHGNGSAKAAEGGAATAVAEGNRKESVEPETPWWTPPEGARLEPALPSRPTMTPEARALENLLVESFDGHDLSLPPLPRIPELVLRKLSVGKSSLGAIAHDISEDQVCATAVLRLANSPLYRGLEKITAIETSVVRLGANAIRTLMMHQSIRTIVGKGKGKNSAMTLAQKLQLRALASAAVMRSLARFTGMDPENAFLIGLLHDIGSVIVLRIAIDQQAFVRYELDDEVFEYLCAETHQEFGELVAESWKLPEELRTLIANHHGDPEPDDPHRTARQMLTLTEMVGALLGYAPYAPYDLLHSRPVADLNLRQRGDFEAFLKGLPDELEEIMAAYA